MSNEITYFERQKLEYLLRTKMSIRAIAEVIRRTHSSLSEEIRNNGDNRKKYRADIAQRKHDERKHQKRRGKLEQYPALRAYVESKLREDWSPEQIAGRLRASRLEGVEELTISHESIYEWIYEKAEKHKKLYTHLRTHRSKRRKHGKRKGKKVTIPSRISIHERPEYIDEKTRYGDWETDTVEFTRGRKNPYLSVQYERKSQLVRIHKLANKSAEETTNALIHTAESVPHDLFRTVTFDNGTEGAGHIILRELFNIDTYFCDPYSSWQKGGVENMNKLIRQYLPRSTNMHDITEQDILKIQERLNSRPRKSLNYLTPNEVIHNCGSILT